MADAAKPEKHKDPAAKPAEKTDKAAPRAEKPAKPDNAVGAPKGEKAPAAPKPETAPAAAGPAAVLAEGEEPAKKVVKSKHSKNVIQGVALLSMVSLRLFAAYRFRLVRHA